MSKFINLVALSTFLAATLSFGPAPVVAVAHAGDHGLVNVARGHDAIAKRKRGSKTKRCKPRNNNSSSSNAPAATTSSSSAAASPTNTGSSNSGSNTGDYAFFGIPYTMGQSDIYKFKQDKPVLYYNWAETSFDAGGDFEFMPMVWGDKNKAAFKAAVDKKTPKFALGPNEPELINDSGLSSGMSTDSVVSLYWEVLDPLVQKGVKVLTPAVTSGDKGYNWMVEFMEKCAKCQFAGQAIHWYDTTADSAKAHFKKHHDKFNLPLYITEIAFNNFNGGDQLTLGDAFNQMGQFNKWATTSGSDGGRDFIEVVMYFGYQDDMVNVSPTLQLIKGSGDHTINDLGWSVINGLKA